MMGNHTHDMQVYAESIRRENEAFITDRSAQEQKFNTWLMTCRKWPDHIKQKLPVDVDNLSIRELIPAWYAENPTEQEATEQVAHANQIIEQVNQIVLAAMEEGFAKREQFMRLQEAGNDHTGI